MNNNIYCKAGNVELTKEEAEYIYNNKLYVVSYSGIYQPHFSQAQNRIYFMQICMEKGLARRGRFYKLSAKEINHIMGFEYLKEN